MFVQILHFQGRHKPLPDGEGGTPFIEKIKRRLRLTTDRHVLGACVLSE